MNRILLFIAVILLMVVFYPTKTQAKSLPWWPVQSIDTMKYSRDLAREKLKDNSFNRQIDDHVKKVAATGATHVAVATPYDEQFLPFLKRWVSAARKHQLNVWFRGNFSGWEGWFGYKKIGRDEHLAETRAFLEKNAELFEGGDIFTPCPECENGGPGDPRKTGDVKGHRDFLIKEYRLTKELFRKMGKQVASNYASMNGDVARVVMDKDTTAALDGLVTVDHYVSSTDTLIKDIAQYAKNSGGKVVLGEWGAPIPDIHGSMTEEDQQKWISEALEKMIQTSELVGLNYWTDRGSSTALWGQNGNSHRAVNTLAAYYTPRVIGGVVTDDLRIPLSGATVKSDFKSAVTDKSGRFQMPVSGVDKTLTFSADKFHPQTVRLSSSQKDVTVRLSPAKESLFRKILKFFTNFLKIN